MLLFYCVNLNVKITYAFNYITFWAQIDLEVDAP